MQSKSPSFHRFLISAASGILFLLGIIPYAVQANGPDTVFTGVSQSFRNHLIPGIVADEDEIRAGLLYDVNRNTIVWQKDMDYAYPVASLTKMMVGLLAIEDIENGVLCADDKITVTRTFKKRISRRRYTTYKAEEVYTLHDLLKMAMVGSHNESTVWIAKHCSGDLGTFVARMNDKARSLGMMKTQYSNPSGLPAIIDELDNSSSARDMLILAMELLKHPQLMEITAIPYATVNNGKSNSTYRNHNGLVINYNQEVDGMKTGFTKAAKYCLVATSNRGGHRLISVVFGVRSPWVRNGIVAGMMNSYYDAIRLGRLGESAPDFNMYASFMDSVNRGLAVIQPRIEQKHKDSSDESYAYTYKTVTTKVKKPHTVKSGESLGKIAGRYNVTVADLKRWNSLKSTTIRTGQRLYVYSTVKKKVPVKLVVDPDESYADNQPSGDLNENVETNVSSSGIEKETSVNDPELKETAVIKKSEPVKKPAVKPAVQPKSNYVIHLVQPGDTLWNIAQRYQANIDQIKKVNNIINSRNLKSGTKIKIPVGG